MRNKAPSFLFALNGVIQANGLLWTQTVLS